MPVSNDEKLNRKPTIPTKSLGMYCSAVDSHIPAVINAFHHPPKGAFAQCADNLICNMPQTERTGKAGTDRTAALEMDTADRRTHESAGRSTDSSTRPLFQTSAHLKMF